MFIYLYIYAYINKTYLKSHKKINIIKTKLIVNSYCSTFKNATEK